MLVFSFTFPFRETQPIILGVYMDNKLLALYCFKLSSDKKKAVSFIVGPSVL